MSGTVSANPAIDATTLADTQAWITALAIPTIAPDQLQQMVTAMSAAIQTWLGYNLAQAQYAADFDGRGSAKVAFPNSPVTAIASLSIDGMAIPASTGPGVAGYVFSTLQPNQSWLGLRGYRFCRGMQNCSISYTAGFAAGQIPPQIVQACREAITALSQVASREPGLIEEKVGGLQENYAPPTAAGSTDISTFILTPTITFALAPLRRTVPAW